MSIEQDLMSRAEHQCEMCKSADQLSVFDLPPAVSSSQDHSIVVCHTCLSQINQESDIDENHWRCLNDSMWSQVVPVQVQAYRQLAALVKAGANWAQDLLDMMYLDDETLKWAKSGITEEKEASLDVNGVALQSGDQVVVIKDLPVKGSSMVVKQGTAVRGISLTDDPSHVAGKVDGQRIYLKTEFLKKK